MLKIRLQFYLCLVIFFSTHASYSKSPNYFSLSDPATDTLKFLDSSPVPFKKRVHLLNYSVAGMYGLSMTWLYTQWYKDYPLTTFHFFNDNDEWLQMDKVGHFADAANISKAMMRCYSWAGYDEKKSTLYGNGISLLFLTTIEVFDGFSEKWGFSYGDMIANVGGAGFFTAQQLSWHEQRMVFKYSFHQTEYAQYRPDQLGNDLPANILKDYNGVTYWLSINPRSFLKSSSIPRWLSIAIGYGAEGMTGATENPTEVNGEPIPQFERYRQYYFSIDFDLARIETKSRFLSSVFKVINIVHLPAPAIELSPGRKPRYWGLYF